MPNLRQDIDEFGSAGAVGELILRALPVAQRKPELAKHEIDDLHTVETFCPPRAEPFE
ncbi:MAG: hypothetical protein WA851_27455 [Xanthobacteraceae bacterium]